MDFGEEIDRLARQTRFSGVVLASHGEETVLSSAYGIAHRGYAVPNTVNTRFAIASGTKGFTALVLVSLIVEGLLSLGTRVRTLLGADLPLIDDGVTVEHRLAHRSGIGDYCGEDTDPPPRPQELSGPAGALGRWPGGWSKSCPRPHRHSRRPRCHRIRGRPHPHRRCRTPIS